MQLENAERVALSIPKPIHRARTLAKVGGTLAAGPGGMRTPGA